MWRRKAIETAGGWNSRTTVEDMDLSLRAYMAGWKAIYLRDVTVLNEVSMVAMRPYSVTAPHVQTALLVFVLCVLVGQL